jgi:hypothetical protein
VGCVPNAASLKNLEQLLERRAQTALLFSTHQSTGDQMTAKKKIGDSFAPKRVVSLAITTSIAAQSDMNQDVAAVSSAG